MGVNLAAIRAALGQQLAAIPGLRIFTIAPDAPVFPCAVLVPGSPTVEYGLTLGGTQAKLTLYVRVFTGRLNERSAEALLDQFLAESGLSSIPAAVAADPTLGGTVAYALVTRAERYGAWRIGDLDALGVQFVVEVWTG